MISFESWCKDLKDPSWRAVIISYIKTLDSNCLKKSGFKFLDPETQVIQKITLCENGKALIRFIPGSEDLRFAMPEESDSGMFQYNVLPIDIKDLMNFYAESLINDENQ